MRFKRSTLKRLSLGDDLILLVHNLLSADELNALFLYSIPGFDGQIGDEPALARSGFRRVRRSRSAISEHAAINHHRGFTDITPKGLSNNESVLLH
jgi:hypothetical protein